MGVVHGVDPVMLAMIIVHCHSMLCRPLTCRYGRQYSRVEYLTQDMFMSRSDDHSHATHLQSAQAINKKQFPYRLALLTRVDGIKLKQSAACRLC